MLERRKAGPLGLLLAVVVTSAGVALLGWGGVATVGEIGAVPRSLRVPVAPVQYAVLAGVGLSMVLHVVRQSNQVTIKRQHPDPDGHLIETDPSAELPADEVVGLQPYGSLFFAAAPTFEAQLPAPAGAPGNSVVILRVRGRTDLGTTFMQVLCRYGRALTDTGSKLVIESASEQLQVQLRTAG